MTTAGCTGNFGTAHAMTIICSQNNCSRNRIIKARPAAVRVKFLATFEQFGAAGTAAIRARIEHAVVFAGERWLRAFFAQDMVLLRGQFVSPLTVGFIYLHVMIIAMTAENWPRLGVFFLVEPVEFREVNDQVDHERRRDERDER